MLAKALMLRYGRLAKLSMFMAGITWLKDLFTRDTIQYTG